MKQRLIDANALKDTCIEHPEHISFFFFDFCEMVERFLQKIDEQPTVDAVPWEFLERYADWFCASVSFPEFIREAKAFYRSYVAAMDDFTIADGEKR